MVKTNVDTGISGEMPRLFFVAFFSLFFALLVFSACFLPVYAAGFERAGIREIAVIDPDVPDREQLVADIRSQRRAGRQIEIDVLDRHGDGMQQIERILARHRSIDVLHIVSHGDAGRLLLSGAWIDVRDLQRQAASISGWHGFLANKASIVLYGCRIAEGEAGRKFVRMLAHMTGMSVAASTDVTGAASKGGDWALEYRTKPMRFALLPSDRLQREWNGTLNTYTVTNTSDSGAGSLRQAILDANSHSGLDNIYFNISGSGVQTISPATVLPNITDPVTLDGTTQPGFVSAPLIEINGALVGNADGLGVDSTAGGSTIKGLIVNGFAWAGISIHGAANITIQGNYLGTDATGTTASANGTHGILVDTGSSNVTIGGTTAAQRNVVSGNASSGVDIVGSTGTIIRGNYIGTNAAGTSALGNSTDGIELWSWSATPATTNTVIGGTTAGARNVISGNTEDGIWIDGSNGTGNTAVQGNYIGTNAAGNAAIANGWEGVEIDSSSSNTIGGTTSSALNVISGNGYDGIYIWSSSGNTIQGNYIGTDATGNGAIANTWEGVEIDSSGSNTIGGTTSSARNVISGNHSLGIYVFDGSGDIIQGNYIGTNSSGSAALANSDDGIYLEGASNVTIGGSTSSAGNIISGNGSNGIEINAGGTHTITGNYIGLDATGTVVLSNQGDGIYISNASNNNTMGGTVAGAGNVVSGNTLNGIEIAGSSGNTVLGNYVGTNAAGNASLGNSSHGVALYGASTTTIGGTTIGSSNVISGNGNNGVALINSSVNNLVQGNYIGINAAGDAIIANSWHGLQITNSSNNNTIGGNTASQRNVISGNGRQGVAIDTNSTGNILKGNYIGLNASGNAALPNTWNGVWLNSDGNTIGGTAAGDGNVISGNSQRAMHVESANSNIIEGNYMGTDAAGTGAVANGWSGIEFTNSSSNNTVGGTAAGAGNHIANNGDDGVRTWSTTTGNAMLGNSIYANSNYGIDLNGDGVTANDVGDGDTGGNNLQNYPVLTSVMGTVSRVTFVGTLNSNASRTYRIEFFSNTAKDASNHGEGQTYLGTINVTTDSSGNASFNTTLTTAVAVADGAWISATATDLTTNDTSEFAQDIQALIITHYQIVHNGTGITCQAETVTITAHNGSHSAVNVPSGIVITLSATYVSGAGSSGKGDWSVITGSGTLNNGAADDGSATYTFPGGESSVTLSYKNTWAQTVTLHVTDGTASDTTGTPDANANMQFVDSGFRFTDGTNPVTIGTQIAGKFSSVNPGAQTLYLQAIRKDINTGACTGVFANGTTVNINMASQCNNPTTCSAGKNVSITNNSITTAIASNPNSGVSTYTSVPLLFGANSQAAFSLNYPDAGQITLSAQYNIPLGTGGASSNYMTGSSNAFVVRPFTFYLSNIKCSVYSSTTCAPALASPGNNPGAANAAGPAFIQAGQDFSATVTAVAWQAADDTNNDGIPDSGANLADNVATPNYGQETSPETISLTRTLQVPSGGNAGTLSGSFGAFSGGSITGIFQWNDVGIIKLTPLLVSGNYLGSGANITGTASDNVGRFIPDHFTLVSSSVTPACSGGGFTYMGQPDLGYAFTIEARNKNNNKTSNYDTATYTAGSVAMVAENNNNGTDLSARLSAVNGNWVSGTFGSALGYSTTGATFSRLGSADGPYDSLQLGVKVIDADSIVLAGRDMDPTISGTCTTSCVGKVIGGSTTKTRFGRLKLTNAFGSELLNLPVAVEAQYYNGVGFVTHTDDSCTAIPKADVIMSNPQANLNNAPPACETTITTDVTLNQGRGNLILSAPGSGNDGSVDLTLNLGATPTGNTCLSASQVAAGAANQSYLQGNWTGTSFTENPTARTRFGVYKGGPVIYGREMY